MTKDACGVAREVQNLVAKAVGHLGKPSLYSHRSGAIAMFRAAKIIKRDAPGLWSAKDVKRIGDRAKEISNDLYRPHNVNNPDHQRDAARVLASIERVSRTACKRR